MESMAQQVIPRVFSLAYFVARSIVKNNLKKEKSKFSLAKNCCLFFSKFPHCVHALFTFNIIKFKKKDTLLSSSFLQDGLERSTPDHVGHHHCFLLITIYKFKKNKMKYLSISFIQDGLEESTPGPVGPHH